MMTFITRVFTSLFIYYNRRNNKKTVSFSIAINLKYNSKLKKIITNNGDS